MVNSYSHGASKHDPPHLVIQSWGIHLESCQDVILYLTSAQLDLNPWHPGVDEAGDLPGQLVGHHLLDTLGFLGILVETYQRTY